MRKKKRNKGTVALTILLALLLQILNDLLHLIVRDHKVGWNADEPLRCALKRESGDHPSTIEFDNADLAQVLALDEMAERA